MLTEQRKKERKKNISVYKVPAQLKIINSLGEGKQLLGNICLMN